MNALVFSLNAVLPLILLVGLGYFLRRTKKISEEFIKYGSKFCFKYAFMAMMFDNVYQIPAISAINWNVILYGLIVVMLLFAIGLAYVLFFVSDPRQKGVVHQAFYRSSYATVGIPLVYNLYGQSGAANATLITAFLVPMYNLLAVISLSVFTGSTGKHPVLYVCKQIVKNPLIQGAAAGLCCVIIRPYLDGWRLSTGSLRFIYAAVHMLGTSAPALALVVLGGQFSFKSVRGRISQLILCVVTRLVAAPVIGMCIVMFIPRLLGQRPFNGAELAALFALFGNMEAIASVAMADQMGNDSELASQILVWTAVFSALTLFLFITAFRATGVF